MNGNLIATFEEAAPRYDSSGAQFAGPVAALVRHVQVAFATAIRPVTREATRPAASDRAFR